MPLDREDQSALAALGVTPVLVEALDQAINPNLLERMATEAKALHIYTGSCDVASLIQAHAQLRVETEDAQNSLLDSGWWNKEFAVGLYNLRLAALNHTVHAVETCILKRPGRPK